MWGIVAISAVLVLSPIGTPLVVSMEKDATNGLQTLGIALGVMFPAATKVGPTSQSAIIDVGVSLPLQNSTELDHLIQQVSNPSSPEFRQFITPSEFTSTFAPSKTSYLSLEHYFESFGLTVQPTTNRLDLSVTGNPQVMGVAFHTTFADYKFPQGGIAFGPTTAPQVPQSLGISGAYGFTNALYNQPDYFMTTGSTEPVHSLVSCPGGYDSPAQIESAYNVAALHAGGYTGLGAKVAIVDAYEETQTILASDLNSFDSDCGLPTAPVNWNYPIPSSTYNTSANYGWGLEEDLDLQWSHVMATEATTEMTFSPDAGNGLYQAIDWLVADDLTNTISLSWGLPDVGVYGGASCSYACNASTDGSYSILHPILQAAAAEGISVFAASGDCGAADGTNTASTNYPASDMDVTGVGGTTLNLTLSDNYGVERAWSGNESGSSCNNGGGAGGGWAPTAQPWYQHGYGIPNKGLRGVPDVGITAGTWLDTISGGLSYGVAGTSDAAPMWAGLTAIADQIHVGDIGLINPVLYSILRSGAAYNDSFHDITTGNNGYAAHAGWDPITGVGTPKANVAIWNIANGSSWPTQTGLVVTLMVSNANPGTGVLVTFTATASGGTGTFARYNFNFGDGNSTNARSTSATHSYAKTGAYLADVEVYDSSGNSTCSPLILISVGTTAFSLALVANNTAPPVGQAVTFTATPTGGTSPYRYQYYFGDGTRQQNVSVNTYSHTYNAAGTYYAQATATDSKNPSDGTVSNVITVTVSPATPTSPTLVSVSVSPSSYNMIVGGQTNFTATPTCNPGNFCPPGTVYSWSLTSTLGMLSASAGNTVSFTAGATTGSLALFVNATLSGVTTQSVAVAITIFPGIGSVTYTLDLLNNTLLPGNSPVPWCSYPTFVAAVSALNEEFVTCDESNNVVIIDSQTGNVEAGVSVGSSPAGIAYDNGDGGVYVANGESNTVSVISGANRTVIATIPVGVLPDGVGVDSASGDIYVTNVIANTVSVISGNTVIKTIPVGSWPHGVAYDSGNGDIYVANMDTNNVSVISGASSTVIKTISVGSYPVGVGYDSSNGDVYVTNQVSNTVSVISGTSNTVVKTISLSTGSSPFGVGYDSVNGDVYVTNQGLNTMSVISSTSNTVVKTIPVGSNPDGIGYDNGNGNLYVANLATDNVSVVSSTSNVVINTILVGSSPEGVEYDPTNGNMYVANAVSNNVSVVSSTSNTVVTNIPDFGSPMEMAYDSSNGDIYVANGDMYSNSSTSLNFFGLVSVISGATNTIVANIPVYHTDVIGGLAYDSSNGDIYLADGFANNVSVISGTSNTIVKTIHVGSYPIGVGYDNSNGDIYVANMNSNNVSVISGTTNAVIATISVGNEPDAIAYDSGNGYVYVANSVDDTVTVISGTTNTVVNTISVGGDPNAVVCDGANGDIYVVNYFSDTVSVISGTTLLGSLSVGTGPEYISYNAGNGYLYITDTSGSAISIVDTRVVTAVSVSPSSSTVSIGNNATFTATPLCTGGICPAGTTYTWTLTNGLGTLNSSTGNFVRFTAGNTIGTVTLFVNATLNGVTKQSAAVVITIIPALASVTVSPSSMILNTGGTQVLTTILTCTGGACPTGTSYSWTLTNNLGTLNSSTSSSPTFTAAILAGIMALFLNVTLNGVTKQSAAVVITIIPGLSSVAVSPSSSALNIDGTQVFTPTVTCTGGGCPSGITYSWSLTNNLGTLNSTTAHPVLFTAGSTGGIVVLFVNATLNGITLQSSRIPVTIAPGLSSVAVSPPFSSLYTDGTQTFTATPACAGGPCPSGVTYLWSLTNNLGSLSSTTASTVLFTAGSTVGTVALFVNVTLNGVTLQSSPIPVAIAPGLSTVAVSPSSATLNTGGTQVFTPTITCTGGGCPSGITYSWSLTNNLGTLNSSTAHPVLFTAGSTGGIVVLFVNATLNGATAQSSRIPVTIVPEIHAVAVTPSSATLNIDGTQVFTPTVTCIGGFCPSGITYSWSLTNNLGTLNSSTAHPVLFTAGSTGGTVVLFVNVTLDGVTSQSSSISIMIVPGISSVAVNPSFASLYTDGTQTFTATATCAGGPCPSGITYSWSLTNNLGSLSSTTASTVLFTAGNTAGTVTLFINATLNGVTSQSSPTPIAIASWLSSVAVSPSSATLNTGGTQIFTPTATCTGGVCPFGVTYSWSLTSNLGTLNSSRATPILFTAGNTSGLVMLFLNATLGGMRIMSTPISITIEPGLYSLTVNPTSATLYTSGTQTFAASPICTGGTCPSGTTYTWSITNGLGTLSSTIGSSVVFTGGGNGGTVTLLVNATLNGVTKQSAAVVITIIPALASVAVSPSSATLNTGGTQVFTPTITCTGGGCPSGVTYSWSLTNNLGTFNSSTSSSPTFTAGDKAGTVTMTVTATLDGKSVNSTVVITVVSPASAQPSSQSSTTWVIIGAIMAAAVIVGVMIVLKRKKKGRESTPS